MSSNFNGCFIQESCGKRVINGDEPWMYGYDMERPIITMKASRRAQTEKKLHQFRSIGKVLLTVFFNCNGVVHHEFLPQGRTVNKEYSFDVIQSIGQSNMSETHRIVEISIMDFAH